jgi:hypothetical protein
VYGVSAGGVVSRVSDERIRELCNRVVSAPEDFREALSELRSALRDRFDDIANVNTAIMLKMNLPGSSEKRAKKSGEDAEEEQGRVLGSVS